MDTFAWTCPYCTKATLITEQSYSSDVHFFEKDNKDKHLALITTVTVCPNPKCKEYEVRAFLHKAYWESGNQKIYRDTRLLEWRLRPQSSEKPLPDYVPRTLVQDYHEACLIRDLSPKASATLSRRCLQGMIRDFWDIRKGRLVDEIQALLDKVDSTTWAAIDSDRKLGNIGAHFESDINTIVDIEPNEAELLIGLIENLLQDWYITRHEKEARMNSLIKAAGEKKQTKKDETKDTDEA